MLAGCANGPAQSNREIVLQDALPGQAIIYLIRAPHDAQPVQVGVSNLESMVLPPNSYTVVSVRPGTQLLGIGSAGQIGQATEIVFHAGERRFFYLSGVNSTPINPTAAMLAGPLVTVMNRSYTVEGTRSWKECSELDARGLISISNLVLPN